MTREIDELSWDEADALCRELAAMIDEPFDAIVCILRGGAIPATIIANELGIELVLGTKIDQGGQQSGVAGTDRAYVAEAGVELVPLNGLDLAGLRVLVVDDVLDSGETAQLVLDTVRARGAAVVRLATMQVKTYARFRPDFWVEERTNWLFYPWMAAHELASMRAGLLESA